MKLKSMMTPPYLFIMHEIAVGSHHRKVRQNFHNLQQAAKVTGKVRIKGVTKFLPTIRALYPSHCTACDNIEKLFKELAELVRQLQRD